MHHVVSLTCTGACAPGIKRPAHAPRRRARTAIAMGTARASWRAGRAPTEGRTSSRHTGDTFDDHEQDARTTTTDGSHRTSTRIGHGGPSRCEDRPRTIRQRERIARRARALRRCSPKRIGDGWLRRRERPLRRAFPVGARGPTRAPHAPCTAEPFAKRIPPAPRRSRWRASNCRACVASRLRHFPASFGAPSAQTLDTPAASRLPSRFQAREYLSTRAARRTPTKGVSYGFA